MIHAFHAEVPFFPQSKPSNAFRNTSHLFSAVLGQALAAGLGRTPESLFCVSHRYFHGDFLGISWGFHGINEGWIWVSKYGEMEYWWDIHDILLKNHGDIMDIYQQLGSYPPMLSLPWLDNPPANLAVKNPQLANAVVDNWTPFFSGSWGFPMFPFFAYRERTYIYLKMTTSVVPRSQDPYLSSQVLASHLDDHWS